MLKSLFALLTHVPGGSRVILDMHQWLLSTYVISLGELPS